MKGKEQGWSPTPADILFGILIPIISAGIVFSLLFITMIPIDCKITNFSLC